MTTMNKNARGERIAWHVLGWLLVLLTCAAWVLMAATGMLERLPGAPDIYAGMDKEQDAFTMILIFIVALPLWVGGFVSLRKAFGSSSMAGRIIWHIGIVGVVLTVLVVLRLGMLK